MDLITESKNYFKKYNVEDVINREMNYLFILESPHKAEIKHGYPVAGNSGVEMTKFIYDQESKQAFGKLVSNVEDYQQHYKGLKQFGIINVAPAPMQASALENYKLSAVEKKIIHILEKLRVNYQAKSHRDQSWNEIKKVLVNDFAIRLNNILSECAVNYLIPCGKLAQSYLELTITSKKVSTSAQIITDIPHPSRNQWRQYSSMKKLEAVLTENIYLK
ncbi:hypothetical protein [Halanaerobacter jeridensis]|uniref:Uracil DNA glycosylase superfamily protein n=1 Tax=Halanaerobacter jeridensis TaxID=706427 RepID=A0A938XSC3_9FIRM|nr:hypothetical protein [Halanaerobacter jeridensis]MBM7555401.1 hypothetical protein [Halanaerobacter jeridensis]